MEQLYDVVANVDDYKYFVPWCRKSEVFEKSESHARANLEVGFPPVSEKYTSVLTLARPNFVKVFLLNRCFFNFKFWLNNAFYDRGLPLPTWRTMIVSFLFEVVVAAVVFFVVVIVVLKRFSMQ